VELSVSDLSNHVAFTQLGEGWLGKEALAIHYSGY